MSLGTISRKKGGKARRRGCWGGGRCLLGLEAAQALAAGVPCGLGGRGSLPQGAGWLWWEQIVFTPSPHARPTLASYSQGSPTPGLCTVCTLAAPIAELPPSAENSSSGGCPGLRRPFLGPLSPIPAAWLKPMQGVDPVFPRD